jgi:hypothetical protein
MESYNRRRQLPWQLTELGKRLQALPRRYREGLLSLCDDLGEWSRRQDLLVQAAQEAVDQFQLDIRYLNFDLEATRRERDAFRQQLEHD